MDVDCLAATIAAFPALAPGDLVADRYRVDAVIGRGAMGVVYRVEHVHMRKRFALKVLDGAWAKTAGALARFEQEAIAAGKIADPHVVNATDFGRLADGSCFLVLEYIDGQTLRTALKRGAFEPRRAVKIARGIVGAMEAAHAAGIVHRDLKPENVMLLRRDNDSDYVKVLDFGIATFASGGIHQSSERLTQNGAVLGTPSYMAPEQVIGGAPDARTDLYSVGIILFELLTGDLPFLGTPASVLQQQVHQEAPPLPPSVQDAVGEPVAEILRRLLAKHPSARFASARELGAALDARLEGARAAGEGRAVQVKVQGIVRSSLALGSALLGKFRTRRARRPGQLAPRTWATVLGNRFRTWRRRRRRGAALALVIAHARRLRMWLEAKRVRVALRYLALTLVAATVLLWVVSAWPSKQTKDANATTAQANSSTSFSPGSHHPTLAPPPGPRASGPHPSGASSSPHR